MNSPKAILKRPGSQSFEEMEFIKRSKNIATIGKVIFDFAIFFREKSVLFQFRETSYFIFIDFLEDVIRSISRCFSKYFYFTISQEFCNFDFTIITRKLPDFNFMNFLLKLSEYFTIKRKQSSVI